MRPTICFILFLLGLTVLGGCGSPTRRLDLAKWRSGVTDYINNHANGDPAVLGDITDAQGRCAFVMLGHPEPDKAADYHGLLVDVQPIGDGTGYIYLVGCVKKAKLTSVNSAVLLADPPHLRWHIGKGDGAGFKTYLAHTEEQWRSLHPGALESQPFYCGFPLAGEQFTAAVSGNTVTITHPASGAKWTVGIR